jgi:hypothetical protein
MYVFGMTRNKRERGRPRKPAGVKLGTQVVIRLRDAEKEAFMKAAAANQNMSISQWLRLAAWRVVNEHNGKVLS